MTVKRSIFALFALCLMSVSLTGCGSSGSSAVSTGNSSSSVSDVGSTGGTVTAGFAKLSWGPPQDQTGLVGFKVHYGTAPGTYTSAIDVGMAATYTITGLGPGTYYFAVTSVGASGVESGYSNEVSKTIS